MKVVILAGGWGTRLGKQTSELPKPMVQIGEKPILWHIMKTYSYYGFKEFIICLGVKGDKIKDYFNNYYLYNNDITIKLETNSTSYITKNDIEDWKVTLVNTGIDTPKGGRIKMIEEYLDDVNMITYGDSLCDVNIKNLLHFHNNHRKLVTITGVHQPARFGEIHDNDGVLSSFEEKPTKSNNMINGGYMVFNKGLLDYLNYDSEFESDTLEYLTTKNEVMVYRHSGNWECMDHDRDYVYLNNMWNNNKAFWKVW